MTTIDKEWLVNMNEMADKAEVDHSYIKVMTTEQLAYLAYWNWGYSGSRLVEVTRAAITELESRNIDYLVLGEEIEEQAQNYY